MPGLAALAALTLGAAAVLVYARVGALHGETVRLYAAAARTDGILAGSEVWLGGQKVGLVDDVRFAPPAHDTTRRVILVLDVLKEYQAYIHRRAPVEIRAGSSIIGARVVHIGQVGGPGFTPARSGDTLLADVGSDAELLRLEAARAGSELPVIFDNVRLLGSHLRAARGTLGAFGVTGVPAVGTAATRAGALLGGMTNGNGTIGRIVSGGTLTERARHAAAAADSLRLSVQGTVAAPGSTPRIDRAALQRAVASARAELEEVESLLAESRGTVGRVQHDRALLEEVARARRELDALIADVQRNPLRYVNF
jgi:phospholipid/cholesterol/gamma-HCH transport system substrate-binding protein